MKINVAQYVFPLGCALINDSGLFCAIQLQQAEMHRNKVAKKNLKEPTSITLQHVLQIALSN